MAKETDRREFLAALGYGSAFVTVGNVVTRMPALGDTIANPIVPKGTYVKADAEADFVFLSGAAALDLYHRHPHVAQDEILPDDPVAQTHMTLRNLFEVLRSQSLSWRHVVKVVRYQKDMAHSPIIEKVMKQHFGDWWPANVAFQIEHLSAPSSLLELEIIAVKPHSV